MRLPTTAAAALHHTRGPAGMTEPSTSTGSDWTHLIPPTGLILAGLAAVIVYGRWLYRVWRDRTNYPDDQGKQLYLWFCPRCLVPTEPPTGLSGECACGTELAVVGPDGFGVTTWQ